MARVLTCGCVKGNGKIELNELPARAEITLRIEGLGNIYVKQGEALYCPFCGKPSEDLNRYLRRKHEEEEFNKKTTKLF